MCQYVFMLTQVRNLVETLLFNTRGFKVQLVDRRVAVQGSATRVSLTDPRHTSTFTLHMSLPPFPQNGSQQQKVVVVNKNSFWAGGENCNRENAMIPSAPSLKTPTAASGPTITPLQELQRLGGVRSVLKLLDSRKTELRETAALVLSNATFNHTEVCMDIINGGDETITPLIEHLNDEADMVSLNVTRVIANCTSACDGEGVASMFISVLRKLGGSRLLIGALSVEGDLKILKPTLLALGNMCCDEESLADEVREMGGLESLAILLQSKDPVVQDNALSALMNCCDGNKSNSQELARLNVVKTLISIVKEAVGSPQRRHYTQSVMKVVRENATQLLGNLVRHVHLVTDELYTLGGLDIFTVGLRSLNVKTQELAVQTLMRCAGATVEMKVKQRGTSEGEVAEPTVTVRPPIEHGEEVRCELRAKDCLARLVWMCDHKKKSIHRCARKCVNYLRDGNEAAQSVLPFIEQGIVSTLNTFVTGSLLEETRIFAQDMLTWLKGEINGTTLQILLRTLNMQGNEQLRGHVAVALVHLAFCDPSARQQFVQKKALRSTLAMLNAQQGQVPALDFMTALEHFMDGHLHIPITKDAPCQKPPKKTQLVFNNPRGADAMLKVKHVVDPNELATGSKGNARQTLWTCHVHKAVLAQHSTQFKDVFAADMDKFEYDIEVTNFDALKALLQYLYTGEEQMLWTQPRSAQMTKSDKSIGDNRVLSADLAVKSMILADQYGVMSAKKAAAGQCLALIDPSTLLPIFHAAVKCKENELGSVCYSYAIENVMSIMRTKAGRASLPNLIATLDAFLSSKLMESEKAMA